MAISQTYGVGLFILLGFLTDPPFLFAWGSSGCAFLAMWLSLTIALFYVKKTPGNSAAFQQTLYDANCSTTNTFGTVSTLFTRYSV
jgi:hypothetical protein